MSDSLLNISGKASMYFEHVKCGSRTRYCPRVSSGEVFDYALSRPSVAFGHENAEKLTVKVTAPLGGTPGGTVTIKIKSTVLCAIRLANGTGSCALSATRLKPGTYSVTASYTGGTYYNGTSATKTLTVTG